MFEISHVLLATPFRHIRRMFGISKLHRNLRFSCGNISQDGYMSVKGLPLTIFFFFFFFNLSADMVSFDRNARILSE